MDVREQVILTILKAALALGAIAEFEIRIVILRPPADRTAVNDPAPSASSRIKSIRACPGPSGHSARILSARASENTGQRVPSDHPASDRSLKPHIQDRYV